MEEILHQLTGSSSYYLQGFIYPRWCRISSITRITNFCRDLYNSKFAEALWRNPHLNPPKSSRSPEKNGKDGCVSPSIFSAKLSAKSHCKRISKTSKFLMCRTSRTYMTVPSSPNVRINNQPAMILSACCLNFHQPISTNLKIYYVL